MKALFKKTSRLLRRVRGAESDVPRATEDALDELAEVTHAIKDSVDLQKWFRGLWPLSEGQRSDRILRTTIDMATKGGSHQLINAFWLLSNPQVFNAVRLALLQEGIPV